MRLRSQILLFSFLFALVPLVTAVVINLPLVLERMELFYHKAHLQNLRADFRDLDQHLASRDEMVRLLAKLPESRVVLGENESLRTGEIDQARTRYIPWINQILHDQLDIIQIVFLDSEGYERFWLDRDRTTQSWLPTIERPIRPSQDFLKATKKLKPGQVLISPISLDAVAGAEDPRRFMTLRLISPIPSPNKSAPIGSVLITIDVGGIARYYRNTLWAHNSGAFLEYAGVGSPQGSAFERYSGLQKIFNQGKLALWEGDHQQIIWIPLFRTEQSGPLWVGRAVDPSPIARFRNAMSLRVLSIVCILILVIWIVSRWMARRVERLSNDLIGRLQKVLENNQEVTFDWKGPKELQQLGSNLSQLAAEHSRNTRKLRSHARKLEETNQYKSEFLANVSHELRTPLNSILLLSKLLKNEKRNLNSEQLQQAKVIHEAGVDLKSLIDNILDLSLVEAGGVRLHLEQIDLRQLLEDLQHLMQPQFNAKGLTLKLEIGADAPTQVMSDAEKIGQIIKNFLSNAVKFTKTGGIYLRLAALDKPTDSDCQLSISVQDSGIGIPLSHQEHIFEAFRQADGSTSRRYGGTGLGLTISRQLARMLGGTIELKSTEGAGATFSLLLPLEYDQLLDEASSAPSFPVEKHLQNVEVDSTLKEHRILLVDDDVQNLLALTPLMEGWGMEVTAAGDGVEALDVLQDESFSIVLMDIVMPAVDGCDTIRRIRAQTRFRDLAIIVFSTIATDSDRDACIEAGADEFIPSPVDTQALKETISRHLRASPI